MLYICMAPNNPFDIDDAMRRIRAAVVKHADAAMFELAARGLKSVSAPCRVHHLHPTRDEVSLPTAIELLERAATPAAMAKLSVAQIDALIHLSSFHEGEGGADPRDRAAPLDEFGGELRCDFAILTR